MKRTSIAFVLLAVTACGTSAQEPHDASTPNDVAADVVADACANASSTTTTVDPTTTPELALGRDGGAPALGVFDPSLVQDGTRTYMTYSVVPSQIAISTRIASSDDRGATFSELGPVNIPIDIPCDAGACPRIIFEVSSIVIDDTDTSARFKIFSHAYVVVPPDKTPHYDIGFIALQTSASAGGPYSVPKPAFDTPAVRKATPALVDCDFFTEPAALVRNGTIDLALGCVNVATTKIRIVLLRSTDRGASFSYVSELLAAADSLGIGGSRPQINAPDLFVAGGHEYLIASPAGPVTLPQGSFDGYTGCTVFDMADSDRVARDCLGKPRVVRSILGPAGQFIGACTFAEGATGAGYVVPEIIFSASPPFRLFRPGIAGP